MYVLISNGAEVGTVYGELVHDATHEAAQDDALAGTLLPYEQGRPASSKDGKSMHYVITG